MQHASHRVLTTRNQPLIVHLIINHNRLRNINLLITITLISSGSMNRREMNRLTLIRDISMPQTRCIYKDVLLTSILFYELLCRLQQITEQ